MQLNVSVFRILRSRWKPQPIDWHWWKSQMQILCKLIRKLYSPNSSCESRREYSMKNRINVETYLNRKMNERFFRNVKKRLYAHIKKIAISSLIRNIHGDYRYDKYRDVILIRKHIYLNTWHLTNHNFVSR